MSDVKLRYTPKVGDRARIAIWPPYRWIDVKFVGTSFIVGVDEEGDECVQAVECNWERHVERPSVRDQWGVLDYNNVFHGYHVESSARTAHKLYGWPIARLRPCLMAQPGVLGHDFYAVLCGEDGLPMRVRAT